MSAPAAPHAAAPQFALRSGLLHLAWVQAVIAMGGSLYLSEVMLFPPCSLCWYQRIAMYPLVAVLGVGLLRRDGSRARAYALPLSIIGLLVAAYHCALTYGLVPEGMCSAEQVSCTIRWLNLYGWLTIPLMSLVAFSVITVSLLLYREPERA
jgi:disulfide bond formation protein DsbB